MKKKTDILKLLSLAGKYKYAIVVVAVGMLLLLFPYGAEKKDSGENTAEEDDFKIEDFEKQIEKVLLLCEGVGRVEVMLAVDSGPESVYAKEARQTLKEQENGGIRENDSDMKPSIMSEGSGKESPIVIKKMYPEFRGAMIVCDGADVISVKNKVIESVASLTGLSYNQISVVKMKKIGGKR